MDSLVLLVAGDGASGRFSRAFYGEGGPDGSVCGRGAEPSQPFGPSGCSRAVSGRRLCKPALRFRTRRMYRSEKRRKLPCEVRRQKKCLRHIRSAERPITVGRQAGDLFEQRAKELRGWKSQLLGDRTDGRFRGQESLPGYLHALEFDVCLRSLARFVLHHIREVCGR